MRNKDHKSNYIAFCSLNTSLIFKHCISSYAGTTTIRRGDNLYKRGSHKRQQRNSDHKISKVEKVQRESSKSLQDQGKVTRWFVVTLIINNKMLNYKARLYIFSLFGIQINGHTKAQRFKSYRKKKQTKGSHLNIEI